MSKRDYYHVSLKLILRNDQNSILILASDPKGSFGGLYDLPGGRIDESEFETPIEQIIRREAHEEIGEVEFELNMKPVAIGRHLIPADMTSEHKDIHIMYIFFEAKIISGEIKLSSEHNSYDWFDLSKQNPADYFTSGILEGINMYLEK